MSLYDYSDGARTVEREFSIGTAPEAIIHEGVRMVRVLTAPVAIVAGSRHPIRAYSLKLHGEMEPELAEKVDAWTEFGTPAFASNASAQKFSDESRRLWDKGKVNEFQVLGDGPSGKECRAAHKSGKELNFDG